MLETERLIIRSFQMDDLEDFYEYAKVEGVGEMAGWRHHRSLDESRLILEKFVQSSEDFAIVWKDTNQVIGSISLQTREPDVLIEGDVQRTIGYVLSKEYWGRGIMPEAVSRMLQYAFEDLGVDVLLVSHFIHNKRSQRVIEKIGFIYYEDSLYRSDSLKQVFLSKKYFYTKDMYERNNQTIHCKD